MSVKHYTGFSFDPNTIQRVKYKHKKVCILKLPRKKLIFLTVTFYQIYGLNKKQFTII